MTPALALLAVRLLLALALYAFLASILIFLWRDLRSGAPAGAASPAAWLASAGEEAASGFPLAGLNLVGRAVDNTIRLDDPTVSAYHARLAFDGGQWILEDLGSRNGSRVNGVAVEGPLVVTYGDLLEFGEVHLRLQLTPGPYRDEGLETPEPDRPPDSEEG